MFGVEFSWIQARLGTAADDLLLLVEMRLVLLPLLKLTTSS